VSIPRERPNRRDGTGPKTYLILPSQNDLQNLFENLISFET
jgi:hypothetical protein